MPMEHLQFPDATPIRDYALIGDCHGAALVSRSGSIDWCCLGSMDATPALFRILDESKGGFLSVRPVGSFEVARAYVEDTNVLSTIFSTPDGTVRVQDFMPVGRQPGSSVHNYVDLVATASLVRIVDVVDGAVELQVEYRASEDFGRRPSNLSSETDRLLTETGAALHHRGLTFELSSDKASSKTRLHVGQQIILMLSDFTEPISLEVLSDQLLHTTLSFWREWISYCRYTGPYAPMVRRSLLTMKQMTFAPTGAIAAAPTTSLPESLGGDRNWDYRFCWLRDASFVLYALSVCGYGGEGRQFSEYLPKVCAKTAPDLQIMYGLDGEADLAEMELAHLQGYAGSRPVRIGNDAFLQRQIDVYGEVLDWALTFQVLGGRHDVGAKAMIRALAEFVREHWREPDQGIWEMRGAPQNHVHGKIMCWVALDRAIKLLGPDPEWLRERDLIRDDVLSRGLHEGRLTQSYESRSADAALLLTPVLGFPLDVEQLARTVGSVQDQLQSGPFVYRYRSDDGLAGSEASFFICSFWLVDALLHLGREDEARGLFEQLCNMANDVGLYSEEIDSRSSAFLGNFPQAYTHLALIGAAVHLELYRTGGIESIKGGNAARARRAVSATLGWRGFLASFAATWRVGRIRSSAASMLDPLWTNVW